MRWQVLLVLAASAVGCNDKYPVMGKVVFTDGTPLSGGIVIFTDEHGESGGYGALGPDGSFEITYDKPRDGLPKGTYQISVRPPSPWSLTDAQRKSAPPRGGIAVKYLQPETSGITVAIDGKKTDLVIQLQREKGLTQSISQK